MKIRQRCQLVLEIYNGEFSVKGSKALLDYGRKLLPGCCVFLALLSTVLLTLSVSLGCADTYVAPSWICALNDWSIAEALNVPGSAYMIGMLLLPGLFFQLFLYLLKRHDEPAYVACLRMIATEHLSLRGSCQNFKQRGCYVGWMAHLFWFVEFCALKGNTAINGVVIGVALRLQLESAGQGWLLVMLCCISYAIMMYPAFIKWRVTKHAAQFLSADASRNCIEEEQSTSVRSPSVINGKSCPPIDPLFKLALIAVALAVVAGSIGKLTPPYPIAYALILLAALVTGFYALIGLVELTVAKPLVQLKSSSFIWAVCLGGLLFFAKVDAQVDLNQMFHIDPTLLPMTLTLATFMHALEKLEWLFYIISAVSLLLFLISNRASSRRNDFRKYSAWHLVNCFMVFLIGIVVAVTMSDAERRSQILYRFAHAADFNTYTPCLDVNPEEFAVLYLDAARTRILLAPKISDSELIEPEKATFLKYVPVPKSFMRRECRY